MQELRGWQKIRLDPGERGTARLVIDTAALSFLGPDLEPRLEPGSFEIRVGPSADPRRQIVAELLLRAGLSGLSGRCRSTGRGR